MFEKLNSNQKKMRIASDPHQMTDCRLTAGATNARMDTDANVHGQY